jgi:glycerol-3-phosphate dehydrogenase (NAD(P)+)
MTLKIGILGGGSWGTTVASLTSRNCPTKIYVRDAESVNEINNFHTNEKYLKGAKLHDDLIATTSIEEAVRDADVIIVGIPSQNFRSVLEAAKPFIRPWIPIISLSKGLEQGTNLRMTEVIENVLPGHPAGVLTGPNLAMEILQGQAAAGVIAMVDTTIATALQSVFRSGLFRVYTNDDLIGCELGGALKNVIAIAVGMGEGAGAGDNTRAAVITRGLAELTRLGVAMGGKPMTFAGLAGMGDLIATCVSPLSRNRYVGVQLGKGKTIQEITAEMKMVAEGVKTCEVVIELAKKYNIEMPITKEVFKVVKEGSAAKDAFKGLLRGKIGSEADPG